MVAILSACHATRASSVEDVVPEYLRRGCPGFGSSVARAGDIDGDGIPDLIVADPGGADVRPRLWLVSGRDGNPLRSISLPERMAIDRDIRLELLEGGVDVDGDTLGDLLVPESSRVWLVSGATGEALRCIPVRVPDRSAYQDVHFVPDFDHDGLADVAVLSTTLRDRSGAISVFSSATGRLVDSIEIRNERWTHYGSFLPVEDLDSDGRADFVVYLDAGRLDALADPRDVSASGALSPCPTSLRAYSTRGKSVIWERSWSGLRGTWERSSLARIERAGESSRLVVGSNERVVVVDLATGASVYEFQNDNVGMQSGFGQAVAAPGDLDGDRVPDFVYSIWDTSWYDGQVIACSGRDGSVLWRSAASGEGDDDLHHLGEALAVIGDVDGDGRADLVVATWMRICGLPGAAEILSGKDGSLLYRFRRGVDGVYSSRRPPLFESTGR